MIRSQGRVVVVGSFGRFLLMILRLGMMTLRPQGRIVVVVVGVGILRQLVIRTGPSTALSFRSIRKRRIPFQVIGNVTSTLPPRLPLMLKDALVPLLKRAVIFVCFLILLRSKNLIAGTAYAAGKKLKMIVPPLGLMSGNDLSSSALIPNTGI